MPQKKMSIANFNIVFYEDLEMIGHHKQVKEAPLLEYLDSIVLPALRSGIVKEQGENKYSIRNARIVEAPNGELVLSGVVVKQTTIEIKSDLDEEGDIVIKNERYSTAPLSLFVVYLKNHKMLLVENQKGSPSIRSFNATIRHILNVFVREQNKLRKKQQTELLPRPEVNIVGVPMSGKLAEYISNVKKIQELRLKFYPLNGDTDIDYSGILGDFSTKIRNCVGSKNGELILKSPQNIEGVKEVIENSQGTVDIIVKCTNKNNDKSTIKNDMISETGAIELNGENQDNDIERIISKGTDIEQLHHLSEKNESIYKENEDRIRRLIE